MWYFVSSRLQLCTRSCMIFCRRPHISASIRTHRSSSCWMRCEPASGNRCSRILRCTAARMLSSWITLYLCYSRRNHFTATSLIVSDLNSTPSDNPPTAISHCRTLARLRFIQKSHRYVCNFRLKVLSRIARKQFWGKNILEFVIFQLTNLSELIVILNFVWLSWDLLIITCATLC